jgi:hypothetical protein
MYLGLSSKPAVKTKKLKGNVGILSCWGVEGGV